MIRMFTIIIVDNETTAMTGGQTTILPSSRLEGVVRGIGVDESHLVTIPAHRKFHEENKDKLRKELAYKGSPSLLPSVSVLKLPVRQRKRMSAS